MNKAILLSAMMLSSGVAYAQYGIGTNAVNNTALFELASTEKGLLIPRMSQTQRDGITTTKPAGLLIYQNDNTPGFYYWNGTAWTTLSSGGSFYTTDGSLTGNRLVNLNGNNLTFANSGGQFRIAQNTTDANPFRILVSKTTNSAGNLPVGPTETSLSGGYVYYEVDGRENHIFGGNVIPDAANRDLGLNNTVNRWDNVYATTLHGTLASTSDIRKKKNVEPLRYGLPEILKLQTITYDWKDNSNKLRKIGFSAQQLQGVMPELVNVANDADKSLSVFYTEMTPVLVNAVKELQAEIDELKAQNAKLSAAATHAEELEKSYAELAGQMKEMQNMLGMKKNSLGNKTAAK